jgi:hypothetical protein
MAGSGLSGRVPKGCPRDEICRDRGDIAAADRGPSETVCRLQQSRLKLGQHQPVAKIEPRLAVYAAPTGPRHHHFHAKVVARRGRRTATKIARHFLPS